MNGRCGRTNPDGLECQHGLDHDDSHKNVTGKRVRYWTDSPEPCPSKGPHGDPCRLFLGHQSPHECWDILRDEVERWEDWVDVEPQCESLSPGFGERCELADGHQDDFHRSESRNLTWPAFSVETGQIPPVVDVIEEERMRRGPLPTCPVTSPNGVVCTFHACHWDDVLIGPEHSWAGEDEPEDGDEEPETCQDESPAGLHCELDDGHPGYHACNIRYEWPGKFDVSAEGVVTDTPRSADRPEEVTNGIKV